MNSGLKCASAPSRPPGMFEVMISTTLLEVDRAALAVGQAPVVHHLQQHVEDVGVGLLDLVEQDARSTGAGARPRSAGRPRRSRRSRAARRRAAATECFSMYSDMSMRTIASCESNMNSASARASSVLPTPVGPRKRKVPIGRSGSLSPARERRSALETAATASSWPMTRWCRRSSMWTSFATSPSSRRLTGMPVQRADDLGDVLGVDLLLEEARRAAAPPARPPASWRSQLGDLAVAQLGGALEVGLALGALELAVGLLEALLDGRDLVDLVLLGLPLGLHAPSCARAGRQLALDRLAALDARVVGLVGQRGELDLELQDAALDLVDLGRQRVDLDAQRARRPRR